ncbi:unnamed protein product [Sphagnum jensenii]|uniref:Uncharacterized protein n=1 Tax=Sphagnum jensenii TaxID=128206 RepID=A0ABP1BFM3_9BRYO
MVNLMQRSDLKIDVRDDDGAMKHVTGKSDAEGESSSWYAHGTSKRMVAQESEFDSDSNEDSDEGTQPVGPVEGESEFGDTELESLVMLEGPQQILHLTLQNQADDFMKEEITDVDDYADWIQWPADGEQRKQNLSEATNTIGEFVLLQIQQMEIIDSSGNVKERIIDDRNEDTRTSGLNLEAQLRRREGYSLSDVVGNQSGLV